jgi:GNAT superfamily N-acetyltransferase
MLRAPEVLTTRHQVDTFDSGVASLDDWLKQRAMHNQATGASRTFVACDGNRVMAYYALASGAVAVTLARGRFRRNMPDPIPVVILARLAIARSHHAQGLGRALFRDAARRVIHAAESIGIRGMLVHAISEEAKAFYIKLGLEVSPVESMTLMATIADLQTAES